MRAHLALWIGGPARACIVATAADAWAADMVVKVKEPQRTEFAFFRDGLVLYTYLHLAAEPVLTRALVDARVTSIAYETIELDDGSLPLLRPMSEVAGRMAVQVGATCLEKERGGKGVLLGGVPGTRRGRVVILGGGVAGGEQPQVGGAQDRRHARGELERVGGTRPIPVDIRVLRPNIQHCDGHSPLPCLRTQL